MFTSNLDAANKTWAAPVAGNWTTAAAWNTAGAPANGDSAFINAAGVADYLVDYDNPSSTQQFTFLTLNNTGGGESRLRTGFLGAVYNVSNATVGGSGKGFWQIGSGEANLGSLNIATGPTGAGTVTLSSGLLDTGRINLGSGGAGVLTQSGGFIDVGTLDIRNDTTGTGQYNFNGGSLNAALLTVFPSGTFANNGGAVTATTHVVLNGGGVTGTFTNNGTFTHNAGAFSGRLINNGTMIYNADFTAGDGLENRFDAALTLNNHAFNFNGAGLAQLASNNIVVGSAAVATTTKLTIGGLGGAATVVQEGRLNVSGDIDLGLNGLGVLVQNSGTLIANSLAPAGLTRVGITHAANLAIQQGTASFRHLHIGAGAVGTLSLSNTGDIGAVLLQVGNGAQPGSGTVNHNGTGARLSVADLQNTARGTYLLSAGTLSVVTSTTNNGTFNQTAGVGTLQAVGGIGTMNITNSASLSVDRIHNEYLFVADTARIVTSANGGANGVSRLNSLFFEDFENLNFFGKWDLNNNDLVIDSDTASQADEYDRTKRYIQSGFGFGGSWTGNGINSSAAIVAAATPNKTGLGYARAADVLSFSGGTATFAGQTVDDTTVLVRYTLLGDGDLDGTVDITDFAFLASNFNTPGDWHDGDFNYDFLVNISDFALLASNFNKVLAGELPRGNAVPEPSISALLGALLLGARKRC